MFFRDYVLWVVKEMKYAKKLIICESRNAIVEATMDPSLLVSVGTLPASLKGKVAADGTFVFTATEDGRFPIGFKAIRLIYNEKGELKGPGGIEFGMGEKRPKLRDDIDDWLNPDKFSDFHMEELVFTREPGGPLGCLPILADDEEGTTVSMD